MINLVKNGYDMDVLIASAKQRVDIAKDNLRKAIDYVAMCEAAAQEAEEDAEELQASIAKISRLYDSRQHEVAQGILEVAQAALNKASLRKSQEVMNASSGRTRQAHWEAELTLREEELRLLDLAKVWL